MSLTSQRALMWVGIVLITIYGLAFGFLCHMIPPPSPNLSAEDVASFYRAHHDSIRIGAVICSWTSAFMVPFAIVAGLQIARQERGRVWTISAIVGGSMMSIFLVLPPLFWGVAAYTTDRPADTTALMHQLGTLTLVTTDQYYLFLWVAVAVICFTPQRRPHSPFSRTFGYYTVWTAFMFEAGAVAFLPKTGAFSWRGALVFWSPLLLFALWHTVFSVLVLRAIRQQREAGEDHDDASVEPRKVPAAV